MLQMNANVPYNLVFMSLNIHVFLIISRLVPKVMNIFFLFQITSVFILILVVLCVLYFVLVFHSFGFISVDMGRNAVDEHDGILLLLKLLREHVKTTEDGADRLRTIACGFLLNVTNTHGEEYRGTTSLLNTEKVLQEISTDFTSFFFQNRICNEY